jgi:hypothetical protein
LERGLLRGEEGGRGVAVAAVFTPREVPLKESGGGASGRPSSSMDGCGISGSILSCTDG